MKFTENYFLAESLAHDPFLLDEGESHHASRVLRLREGDEILVTDGQGQLAECWIETIHKQRVCLRRKNFVAVPPPAIRLTLYPSVIKKPLLETQVELLCQLPIEEIRLLITERSAPWSGQNEHGMERLREKSRVALKQSRKTHLTRIEVAEPFANFFNQTGNYDFVCAFEKGTESLEPDAIPAFRTASTLAVLIGPEGGFGISELELMKQKNIPRLGLGTTRLRSEAAAFAAAVKLLTLKGCMQ